jgi:ABC-2 type transport system ATP-binding protein
MALLLEAQGLSKLYGVVIGVNDLTLALQPGVHGILGPNGAGKSTFLKLLTGQLRPTEGRIRVLGENPWNHPALFRRIGYCPEHDAFWDFQSALEFVGTLAMLSGLSRAEARPAAERALRRVGAGEFMHRRISTYSKGMRQRTKVAQALVHEPELLVLDEPLTGTDPVGRRDLMQLVHELGREGRSVLVSSHVMHEVQAMTSRFLLIFGGRVLAAGEVQEIRALLDRIPHRVRIRCDDARALAQRLVGLDLLNGLDLDAEQGELHLTTRDPGALFVALPEEAARAGVSLLEFGSEDESLDAVFAYLVGGGL